ncbi:unnamed protein product [Clonostachys rosea f. rosea IK726]|uniref:Uncharacterized protein n=2 Tax=Bionectria ochroleuca TaxID=29856 RepID=A0A0B7KEZ3_BIOOC|nr:unnamed protein product [Clonostachys rosea f. rosea IK726]
MSMKQYAYRGFGENNQRDYWYSSNVRTGDFVHCAGQGSYLDEHGTQPKTIAFVNVDIALKDAGGAGWSQIHRVNSFHVQLDPVSQEPMIRNFKKWMPGSHPTWTCVHVGRLGGDSMWVEIEVSAFCPEGAKREGTSKA